MPSLPSAQRYKLLVEQAPDVAAIFIDPNGTIVEWSSGAEQLLGWPSAEAVGQPIAMIYLPEDIAAGVDVDELNSIGTATQTSDTRWHRRKDGTTVFCDGTVNKLYDEDGHSFLGFGKIVRAAYSENRHHDHCSTEAAPLSFLGTVLGCVKNGIVACDNAGRLTFFNQAARAMHGLEDVSLSYEHWAQRYGLYRSDGITILPLQEVPLYRALQGEHVIDADMVVVAVDGRRHHVKATGRPLDDGRGRIVGAVVSLTDTTARHEASREQERRQQAERSEEQLREAQLCLKVATEAADLGVWTWNVRAGTGTWENRRMHDIFGVQPGVSVSPTKALLAARVHPDDAIAFRTAVEEAIHQCQRLSYTGRF